MGRERVADLMDCFNQGVAEFFVFKMAAHPIDKALPELLATFFMNGLVADHGKFVRTRSDENQNSIAFVRFMYPEFVKFLLRGEKRITAQIAALDINADLARSFRFRLPDRLHNAIVLEFADEFFRAHRHQLPLEPPPPKLPPPPLKPLNPPPLDDQPLPEPPDHPPTKGPPNPE
jgi:hypothetical protein